MLSAFDVVTYHTHHTTPSGVELLTFWSLFFDNVIEELSHHENINETEIYSSNSLKGRYDVIIIKGDVIHLPVRGVGG